MLKKKYAGLTDWQDIYVQFFQWLNYRIVGRIDSWLTYHWCDYLDQHCECDVCHGKYKRTKEKV